MATLATIRNSAYTAFYNLLQTGTYAITTNNIHPRVSDAEWAQDNRGYPVVEVVVNVTSKPDKRFGGLFKTATGETTITVWHNSSENIKTTSDEIDAVFQNDGALKVLAGDGFFINDVSSEVQEPEDYGGKKVRHSEVITIDWRWSKR